MAHGGQDWISRTDILLQTISHLTIRPTYGQWQHFDGLGPGLIGEQTLISVSGKGIIYGGFVHSGLKDNIISLTVDGVAGSSYSYLNMHDLDLTVPAVALFHLTRYDEINNKYNVALLPGITFESTCVLKMNFATSYGGYQLEFNYALIE